MDYARCSCKEIRNCAHNRFIADTGTGHSFPVLGNFLTDFYVCIHSAYSALPLSYESSAV